jgi:hypothetical protein
LLALVLRYQKAKRATSFDRNCERAAGGSSSPLTRTGKAWCELILTPRALIRGAAHGVYGLAGIPCSRCFRVLARGARCWRSVSVTTTPQTRTSASGDIFTQPLTPLTSHSPTAITLQATLKPTRSIHFSSTRIKLDPEITISYLGPLPERVIPCDTQVDQIGTRSSTAGFLSMELFVCCGSAPAGATNHCPSPECFRACQW